MSKKATISIVSAILLVVLTVIYFSRGEEGPQTIIATRGLLVQEVSVTGEVRPQEEVDLAFLQSGIISSILYDVGDNVVTGAILATQKNNELQASKKEAEAVVKVEEAKLAALLGGARGEEIGIKESELESARADLTNLYNESGTVLQDAQNNAENALNEKIEAFFTDDNTGDPQLTFYVIDQSIEFDVESRRVVSREALNNINSIINRISLGGVNIEWELNAALVNLRTIESFLVRVGDALNSSAGVTSGTLSTYKTDLNTARSNLNMVITSVETQIQNIRTKKIAVEKTEKELELLLAGSRKEDISAQEAVVEKAYATLQKIEAQIANTILRSPISGIVTKVETDPGETIGAGVSIISVISDGKFEIRTNIPEADITAVKLGDSARITLDAYGRDEIFSAKVVRIDPAETTIESVSTYKVILLFDDDRGLVRSGMTANVDIITKEKENVLLVPSRAVLSDGDRRYIRVLEGGLVLEKNVKTGIKDFAGNIEILDGLNEGENVVTFILGQ